MAPLVPFIAPILAGTAAATTVYSAYDARKSRKQAAADSARERDALAQLQQEPEKAIPNANSDAVKRQRRRSIASMQRRRGRQSTILTGGDAGDRLGG